MEEIPAVLQRFNNPGGLGIAGVILFAIIVGVLNTLKDVLKKKYRNRANKQDWAKYFSN